MNYYHDEKNVENYIQMADGFDGSEFIPILRKYLIDGASLLELGMGPGKDVDLLSKYFNVTGSDNSEIFLERYRKRNPDADLILLDAAEMQIDRKFDCIYSNKVLQHLERDEMAASLRLQGTYLRAGGFLFHSLWYGDGEDIFDGLKSVYYTEEAITKLLPKELEIFKFVIFKEMEPNNSFYIILRRKL